MEHVVFFPAADGTAFRRLPSLEEAVRLVEHLRNVEGVADVTLHALTEVPLSFRTYYRVEVPAGGQASAAAAPRSPEVVPVPPQAVPAQPTAAAPVPPQPSETAGAPAPAEPARPAPGRGKDGPGSVGFFA